MPKVTQQDMAEFIGNLSLSEPQLELPAQPWNCTNLGVAHEPSSAGSARAALCWPGDPHGVEYTLRSGVAMLALLFLVRSSGSLGSPTPRLRWGAGGSKASSEPRPEPYGGRTSIL